MNFGLSDKTINKLCSVFEKYLTVEKVIIYGSRAKGNYREGSDIGFALVGENITETQVSSIHIDIDDLNTPYLTDLLVLNRILSDSLLAHIQRVGKEFYKRGDS